MDQVDQGPGTVFAHKQSLPARGTPELRLGVATTETIFRIGNGKPLGTEGKKQYFGIVRVRRQRSFSRQTGFDAEKYRASFPIPSPNCSVTGSRAFSRMITDPSDICLSYMKGEELKSGRRVSEAQVNVGHEAGYLKVIYPEFLEAG